MTTATAAHAQPPLLGALAHEVTANRSNLPLYLIAVLLGLWGAAVYAFGLPGLYLPAVVAAPLMIVVLVLISRG